MIICEFHQLGRRSYKEVWELQQKLFAEIIEDKRNGKTPLLHLIFVEHPPVYTFGKHAKKNHLLATPAMLSALGAEVFEIERGGDITYHGPGQLVVYPIFDLEQLNIGIKTYVSKIESCISEVLQSYQIESGTISDRIGVWLDIGTTLERKIAAIGIKSSRYVTMHGLALNVNTDLNMFNHIIPCGIPDKAVTSISKELNEEIDFFEVNLRMKNAFERIFELQFL
jgi:lipoyl(octanoyl) transferase